jgi:DDE superfamily endonuclease
MMAPPVDRRNLARYAEELGFELPGFSSASRPRAIATSSAKEIGCRAGNYVMPATAGSVWARQAALQIRLWLPDRYIVLVADSAFAAIEFLAAVRNHVCVVTRLRLDANLFDFPPQKRKGRGRPPIKGKPMRKLSGVLKDRRVCWQRTAWKMPSHTPPKLAKVELSKGWLPPSVVRHLTSRERCRHRYRHLRCATRKFSSRNSRYGTTCDRKIPKHGHPSLPRSTCAIKSRLPVTTSPVCRPKNGTD